MYLDISVNKVRSNIFLGLMTVVILLASGYALNNVYDLYTRYILMICAGGLIRSSYICYDKDKDSFNIKAAILFCFLCICTCVYTDGRITRYAYTIFIVLLALEISICFDNNSIIKIFVDFTTMIAAISLLFYVAVNLFNLELPIVQSKKTSYGNAWFFVYLKDNTRRNCGVFWEPCLYAEILSLAMVFIVLNSKIRYKKLKFCLLLCALLSTNSSTGIILLLLVLCLVIIHNVRNKFKPITKYIVAMTLLIVVFCVIVNWDTIIQSIFYDNEYIVKLLSSNIERSPRYKAVFANLSIFLEHPIGGVGYEQYLYLTRMIDSVDTATSLSVLAIFGVSGIIFSLLVVKAAFTFCSEVTEKIILLIILFIIVNAIPHQELLITWIFLFVMSKKQQAY